MIKNCRKCTNTNMKGPRANIGSELISGPLLLRFSQFIELLLAFHVTYVKTLNKFLI